MRATMDVTFKEYPETANRAQLGKQSSAHFEKQYVVKLQDTLSSIAGEFLGDPRLWREIAAKNDIDNPLSIKPGDALIIPATEA